MPVISSYTGGRRGERDIEKGQRERFNKVCLIKKKKSSMCDWTEQQSVIYDLWSMFSETGRVKPDLRFLFCFVCFEDVEK